MALLSTGLALSAEVPDLRPRYTSADLVNAASQEPSLAPNSLAMLHGENLSYYTEDAVGLRLPDALAGVRLLIGGIPVPLIHVSPKLVTFLVPATHRASSVSVALIRQSLSGPQLPVILRTAAPALFLGPDGLALACHLDWSAVRAGSPARGGEVIELFATGLGPLRRLGPPLDPAESPGEATGLAQPELFSVLLNGVPLDPSLILYAGVAVGFVGLYQVNLLLPADLPLNPEIRLALGEELSPAGVQLLTGPFPEKRNTPAFSHVYSSVEDNRGEGEGRHALRLDLNVGGNLLRPGASAGRGLAQRRGNQAGQDAGDRGAAGHPYSPKPDQ